jgi:glycosyltransferase involved in cell wall biosynthesis
VSVVLPVRNEVHGIRAALSSALEQEYDHPIQVVVADGSSTDGTWELLEEMQSQDARIKAVRNPIGTTPAGLNTAIRAADGDVIVRLDGHAELPAGYVQRAVERLTKHNADNVGGIQAAVGGTPLQSATAIAMTTPLGVGDARFHIGGEAGPVDTVYLGVFRRDVFERFGFFDEGLLRNQDYELNYRIRAGGGIVWFDPGLRVEYRPRSSLSSLWSQYYQYGAWKRVVVKRHPGSTRWRQLVPPVFVLALVASAAATATPIRRASFIVPAAYLIALISTTAVEAGRRRTWSALLLPVVLPTMHIAWGLGFLVGARARTHSSNER